MDHFNFAAIAQEIIDEDPLFESMDIDDQQSAIEVALIAKGADPNPLNIGVMLKYVTNPDYRARWAGAATPRPKRLPKKPPEALQEGQESPSTCTTLLTTLYRVTGFTDAQMGALLGRSRMTMYFRRHGKVPDTWSESQRAAARRELENRALAIAGALDELGGRSA